jgi:hypothetical protein
MCYREHAGRARTETVSPSGICINGLKRIKAKREKKVRRSWQARVARLLVIQ